MSRGIAVFSRTFGTRWGGGQPHVPPASTPGKDPLTIVQEAGWAPGPVWTGAKNLASKGIRSPDRPTRSQSLYRLSYPAHCVCVCVCVCVYIYIYIYIYIYMTRKTTEETSRSVRPEMVNQCPSTMLAT